MDTNSRALVGFFVEKRRDGCICPCSRRSKERSSEDAGKVVAVVGERTSSHLAYRFEDNEIAFFGKWAKELTRYFGFNSRKLTLTCLANRENGQEV